MKSFLPIVVLGLFLCLLAGCGGSSNSALPQASSGGATFSVLWPEPSRLIPVAANSIKITLKKEASIIGERILVRPAQGGQTSASFENLPVGELTATAAAYPTQDGSGTAQAQASVPVTIVSGLNAPLRLTMASTIDRVEIAPTNPSVAVNANVSLVATARDTAANVVLTAPTKLKWASDTPTVARVDEGGRVTGVAPGTAQVTATESESGKSASVTVSVTAMTEAIRKISLLTSDLIYDRVSDKIFASVPSRAGVARGNSITSIDPNTGAIGTSVFVGSEPNKMAITGKGTYIYVGCDGAAIVSRYDVVAGKLHSQFKLGGDSTLGSYFVEDIEARPGTHDTVAVSRRNVGFSPRHEGVAIYINGVLQTKVTPGHTGSNVIEFGDVTNRLYGYNNETTEFGFRRMALERDGVTVVDVADSFNSNLISGFGVDIEFDNNRIYATSGRVISPEGRTLLGTFPASGPVRPDSALNRVFFLTGGSNFATAPVTLTLRAFDPDTFLEVASLSIPNVTGTPTSLIRWGAKGLAFRTTNGEVYIIATAPGT